MVFDQAHFFWLATVEDSIKLRARLKNSRCSVIIQGMRSWSWEELKPVKVIECCKFMQEIY